MPWNQNWVFFLSRPFYDKMVVQSDRTYLLVPLQGYDSNPRHAGQSNVSCSGSKNYQHLMVIGWYGVALCPVGGTGDGWLSDLGLVLAEGKGVFLKGVGGVGRSGCLCVCCGC